MPASSKPTTGYKPNKRKFKPKISRPNSGGSNCFQKDFDRMASPILTHFFWWLIVGTIAFFGIAFLPHYAAMVVAGLCVLRGIVPPAPKKKAMWGQQTQQQTTN